MQAEHSVPRSSDSHVPGLCFSPPHTGPQGIQKELIEQPRAGDLIACRRSPSSAHESLLGGSLAPTSLSSRSTLIFLWQNLHFPIYPDPWAPGMDTRTHDAVRIKQNTHFPCLSYRPVQGCVHGTRLASKRQT